VLYESKKIIYSFKTIQNAKYAFFIVSCSDNTKCAICILYCYEQVRTKSALRHSIPLSSKKTFAHHRYHLPLHTQPAERVQFCLPAMPPFRKHPPTPPDMASPFIGRKAKNPVTASTAKKQCPASPGEYRFFAYQWYPQPIFFREVLLF